MVALIIQAIDAYCTAFIAVPIVVFLVTGCCLLNCIVEDITNDLRLLNVSAEFSNENHKKILNDNFRHIIQDFSDAKQLSKRCFEIFCYRFFFNNHVFLY